MAKNFAVVTFPSDGNNEEEIVSEVPSLWLSFNLKECWWPLVKNVNTFIIKQIPPVINDPKWESYPIKFHGYYDSLEEARQRATNYSSSEESNINEIKKSRTRQLNKTVSHNESESDSDDSRLVIPNPPNLTVNTNASQSVNKSQSIATVINSSVVSNDIDLEILDGTLVPLKSIQDVHTLISDGFEKMEGHFKNIYTAITTVTLGIQDLNVHLTNIEKQNNQHKSKASVTDTSNIHQFFPFKNINEVTAFENRLSENVDEYNKFMLYISRIGGRSAKENLIRIYRTLFSNEVAKESSWKGLRNHFKISSLKYILMGILATISGQHQFTNKEFEEVTKEWFRQGGQRLSRQKDFEEINPQVI
ncbi:uncharacterized protein LOC114942157 [Nylanderia fulva]|nr:uncharacterized protein LOC114928637 isoform X2 [Nylanderia fulva]XP_029156843.1 uncharacterized protein LOC114929464 isoform X2 [Nylanderia fulva]XP_029157974.1 uncharacterized protein LOC114930377 [Nylanderia fulva]XP_029160300.1 uncharacterized protein LOC114932297 [Nylanderia fulva]XP_029161157.1 uncharacterized protein LOC114932911 [Nylanderia fulva]XP_029161744.1 uncharacterized protein LOC114933379 [Nylanderia fulva]XP_029162970.1 uncharacterized protein LOC114934485 [Nylanderia ful